MDKQALDQMWDQLRQKYGVYVRLLEAIPEESYHTHPVPGMRSVAELLCHVSGTVIREIAQGVAKGQITADESQYPEMAKKLGSKKALLAFANTCWADAAAAVTKVGNSQLTAMVPTPWNMTFPGWVGFNIMHDEFLHHRGQISVYCRLAGVEPPFIWDYAKNAPAYRPAA
jgi:uncharacterized damage-inducible protein DinB